MARAGSGIAEAGEAESPFQGKGQVARRGNMRRGTSSSFRASVSPSAKWTRWREGGEGRDGNRILFLLVWL